MTKARFTEEFNDAEIEYRYFNGFDEAFNWLSSVVLTD